MTAQPITAPDVTAAIRANVIDIIKRTAANTPRSQQRSMGPSEFGHPCARRLAYRMLDWPQINTDTDPLAAIIGTAVHGWLEGAFAATSATLPDGRPRYVIEQRVNVDAGLAGSADLLDRELGAVIDWKVPGATAMREYRDKGPSQQYRVQAHAYGLGYRNAGENIDHVAIVFIPRSGQLKQLHVWSEPLNVALAQEYLDRRDSILILAGELDVERNPHLWHLIPTADSHCAYCPWFMPGSEDLATGCPGDPGRDTRPAQFTGLIG